MKLAIVMLASVVAVLLWAGVSFAQECGPSCPVCSGAGSNAGALLAPQTILVSGLSIPDAEEETVVANIKYGVLNWLDAGLGYAIETEKVLWHVRTQPIVEQKNGLRPGVILGTGSVQTGGSDQSLYVQLVKSLEVNSSLDFQVSAGTATLLPDFDEFYGLAGITANLYKRLALFANYDGEAYHEGLSWIPIDWLTVSFLYVETENPAILVAFRI